MATPLLAVECEVAANRWFAHALQLQTSINLNIYDRDKYTDNALEKAALYEAMAHDGRK